MNLHARVSGCKSTEQWGATNHMEADVLRGAKSFLAIVWLFEKKSSLNKEKFCSTTCVHDHDSDGLA